MSSDITNQKPSRWSGRMVARVLPVGIDEEFDRTNKPLSRKINPSTLTDFNAHRQANASKNEEVEMSWGTKDQPQDTQQLDDDSNTITIDVSVKFDALPEFEGILSQSLRVTRTANEEASKCMNRIGISLIKKLNGTNKKRKGKNKKRAKNSGLKDDAFDVRCIVRSSPSPDDNDVGMQPQDMDLNVMTNLEFWKKALTASVAIEMKLEGVQVQFDVVCNPPTVVGVRTFENFCGQNFPGIPLVVDADLLFATHAVVDWYVDGKLVQKDSRGYTPTLQDATKTLAITITPTRLGSVGATEAYEFTEPIACSTPENALLSLRPEWQRPRCSTGGQELQDTSDLRIMTYNILADQNAFSKTDNKKIPYFPYVPTEIMVRSRRMPLLLHEILAYQGDIICLQEVDEFIYNDLLRPVLEYRGYQGYFSVKQTSGTQEGCATFWSLKRFQKAQPDDCKTFRIGHLLAAYGGFRPDDLEWSESVAGICQLLETRPDLLSTIRDKLGHVVQIVHLTDKQGNNRLVVGNTHLFFHPNGNHIRMLQCFAVCKQLALERHTRGTIHREPIILCGDLNTSLRNNGALMIQRSVPQNYRYTQTDLNSYRFQNMKSSDETGEIEDSKSDIFPSLRLADTFPIVQSAYSTTPAFTHYVQNFQETLDHVLISVSEPDEMRTEGESGAWPRLLPLRSAAMPTEEEVTRDVAMPSARFPSDHVSLVCDVEWKVD